MVLQYARGGADNVRRLVLALLLCGGCGRLNFESLSNPVTSREGGSQLDGASDGDVSNEGGVSDASGERDGAIGDAAIDGGGAERDGAVITDGSLGMDAMVPDASTGPQVDPNASCDNIAGSVIFCDGFDDESIASSPWTVGFAATWTTPALRGEFAMRGQVQMAGQGSAFSLRDLSPLSVVNNGRFYFRIHVRTANAFDQFVDTPIIELRSSGNNLLGVGIDNNVLYTSVAGTVSNTGQPAFPRTGWVCITAEMQLGPGGWTRVWLNDAPAATINHSMAGPPTSLALGILGAGTGSSDLDIHMDEIAIDDQPIPCIQ